MNHTQPLYTTQNRFLAKAIAFNGIPFTVYREYDQEYLEKHGCKTVKDAERRRLPGREMWAFESSDKIKIIENAFDSENDAIDELVKSGSAIPFCDDAKIDTKPASLFEHCAAPASWMKRFSEQSHTSAFGRRERRQSRKTKRAIPLSACLAVKHSLFMQPKKFANT